MTGPLPFLISSFSLKNLSATKQTTPPPHPPHLNITHPSATFLITTT